MRLQKVEIAFNHTQEGIHGVAAKRCRSRFSCELKRPSFLSHSTIMKTPIKHPPGLIDETVSDAAAGVDALSLRSSRRRRRTRPLWHWGETAGIVHAARSRCAPGSSGSVSIYDAGRILPDPHRRCRRLRDLSARRRRPHQELERRRAPPQGIYGGRGSREALRAVLHRGGLQPRSAGDGARRRPAGRPVRKRRLAGAQGRQPILGSCRARCGLRFVRPLRRLRQGHPRSQRAARGDAGGCEAQRRTAGGERAARGLRLYDQPRSARAAKGDGGLRPHRARRFRTEPGQSWRPLSSPHRRSRGTDGRADRRSPVLQPIAARQAFLADRGPDGDRQALRRVPRRGGAVRGGQHRCRPRPAGGSRRAGRVAAGVR